MHLCKNKLHRIQNPTSTSKEGCEKVNEIKHADAQHRPDGAASSNFNYPSIRLSLLAWCSAHGSLTALPSPPPEMNSALGSWAHLFTDSIHLCALGIISKPHAAPGAENVEMNQTQLPSFQNEQWMAENWSTPASVTLLPASMVVLPPDKRADPLLCSFPGVQKTHCTCSWT